MKPSREDSNKGSRIVKSDFSTIPLPHCSRNNITAKIRDRLTKLAKMLFSKSGKPDVFLTCLSTINEESPVPKL